MELKLFDSELKIMEQLWENGELTAKELAQRLKEQVGWSKTTTYTVIKKCIDKGVISRSEPNFLCSPEFSREQVQQYETNELIEKMYGGAPDKLIASILGSKRLTAKQIDELRKMMEEMK